MSPCLSTRIGLMPGYLSTLFHNCSRLRPSREKPRSRGCWHVGCGDTKLEPIGLITPSFWHRTNFYCVLLCCLSPSTQPKQSGAAVTLWEEGSPSIRLIVVFVWKWTLLINTKTSWEEPMPAMKYFCYLQADTVQPYTPIREGRPLHQLNEPSDLHANKGGSGGAAFITAEKGLEMLTTHGLSLGNCSLRIT